MIVTYFIAGALALFLACAYLRFPLWAWTLAFGALVVSTGSMILVGLFLVLALLLNLPPLRRTLISNRVLAVYRRILPDMSQTEKEAIDAGTVWWDADLFSGKPDWDKLLAVKEPKLTPEEQAFLDGPVEELCRMCDDWEISHERQDLPPQVWQFIKD